MFSWFLQCHFLDFKMAYNSKTVLYMMGTNTVRYICINSILLQPVKIVLLVTAHVCNKHHKVSVFNIRVNTY